MVAIYQVYGIRCKENGKIYIGCTKNKLQERFSQHLGELKRGIKTTRVGSQRVNSDWQEDFNKYGIDSFELYLIEDNIPDDKSLDREQYWMREYKSFDEKYGYNIKWKSGVKKYEYFRALPPKPFNE